MIYRISTVILFLGLLISDMSVISGIGYGLYNWGSIGLELGKSAWIGFTLFGKMLVSGIIMFGIGLMGVNKW